MNLSIIFILFTIVLGAILGQWMMADSGYVLLGYKNTTVEMTLWIFLILAIIVVGVVHLLLNIINTRIPMWRFKLWRSSRCVKTARKQTLEGLLALTDGDWYRAHKKLTQGADNFGLPALNYLAAAKAAHEIGSPEETDALLTKAMTAAPEASLTIKIAKAQMQASRGELHPALTSLIDMRRQHTKNKQILALMSEIAKNLGDWQTLLDILPDVRRYKAVPEKQLLNLEEETCLHLLEREKRPVPGSRVTPEQKIVHLQSLWATFPKTVITFDAAVAEYARQLIENKGYIPAEILLRDRLNQRWSDELIALYGLLENSKPRKLYQQAQMWQSSHEFSSGLYVALGRLACKCELWEEAVSYYQKALELEVNLTCAAELARLLKQLDQKDKAVDLLFKSFDNISGSLAHLPAPSTALEVQQAT